MAHRKSSHRSEEAPESTPDSARGLKDVVLKSLPTDQYVVTDLRLKHVGSVVEEAGLRDERFVRDPEGPGGWTIWRKKHHRGGYRVSIVVEPDGAICGIYAAEFIDLQSLDGIGAPYGWYQSDQMGPTIAKRLSESLARISVPRPTADARQEWMWYLKPLGVGQENKEDPAFTLTCFANAYREHPEKGDGRLATLYAISLVRHLESISNEPVLNDLPFLCGRLRLRGECVRSIRRLFTVVLSPHASSSSNLGAVLCDNLRLPRPGLRCFEHAIGLDPTLKPPRQAIWIAGRDILIEAILDQQYDAVNQIYERVLSLGDPELAHHGFWSCAGICYEGVGDTKAAIQCHGEALQLHPKCSVATPALKRLTGNAAPSDDFGSHVLSLRHKLRFNRYAEEPEDYKAQGVQAPAELRN